MKLHTSSCSVSRPLRMEKVAKRWSCQVNAFALLVVLSNLGSNSALYPTSVIRDLLGRMEALTEVDLYEVEELSLSVFEVGSCASHSETARDLYISQDKALGDLEKSKTDHKLRANPS